MHCKALKHLKLAQQLIEDESIPKPRFELKNDRIQEQREKGKHTTIYDIKSFETAVATLQTELDLLLKLPQDEANSILKYVDYFKFNGAIDNIWADLNYPAYREYFNVPCGQSPRETKALE